MKVKHISTDEELLKMEVRSIGQEEWTDIASNFEDLSLMQTWEFGEVKAKLSPWKVTRALFWQDEKIVGAAQGLMRTIPGLRRGLVWINRAPLWRRQGEDSKLTLLAAMLQELRRYWVEEKKMYLRIAPTLLCGEESEAILKESGFKVCHSGWSSALIDLSLSETALFEALRKRWRQYFRALQRLGISCVITSSSPSLNELLLDYQELITDRGFKISQSIDPEFIQELQNQLPDDRKMLLFIGMQGEKILGRLLVARYGNICMAYVIGKNESGRELHINHFLYWQAICEMKRLGFRWFDVGGADPEEPSGILHFKQGLGGKPYRLVGEFEAYQQRIITKVIKWGIRRGRDDER